MRTYTSLFICVLTIGGLACKDEPESPPQEPAENTDGKSQDGKPQSSGNEPEPSSKTPWAAGGTTGDFGGDCSNCEDPAFEELEVDDDERLGFSAEDVFAVVEGVHIGSVRWRDACAQGECESLDVGCPRDPLPFGGTETELRVEVQRAGSPMLETCPERDAAWVDAGGYENCAGTFLHLPIDIALSTSDGVFSATIEGEELLINPHEPLVGVGVRLTPDQIEGTLASSLAALEVVEWQVWFDEQGPGADLYLLGATSGFAQENLGQLEAAGLDECLVGFPLTSE